MNIRLYLLSTIFATGLIAAPIFTADVLLESNGTNTVVILRNKAYSIEEVTKLLKNQQLLTSSILYIMDNTARECLDGKAATNLLSESKREPYIQVGLGTGVTSNDFAKFISSLKQAGITNIIQKSVEGDSGAVHSEGHFNR